MKHSSVHQYEAFVCTYDESDFLSVLEKLVTQFSLVLPQSHYLIKY
jgi:hypothetical protein